MKLYHKTVVLLAILFLGIVPNKINAQIFQTRVAHIFAKSTNRVLDVEADNYQVYSTINAKTGEVLYTGLIKSFEMKLGAVDRAFNSEKVDVSGYPKFRFEGRITNFDEIDFDVPGTYTTQVKGTLTIGDEKRTTSATGRITINSSASLKVESEFLMTIEKKNMEKVNKLMKERLPASLGIDASILGISRDIFLKLKGYYRKKG